jgi:hypothetical protein
MVVLEGSTSYLYQTVEISSNGVFVVICALQLGERAGTIRSVLMPVKTPNNTLLAG